MNIIKKIAESIKSFVSTDFKPASGKILIWDVVEGPFNREDFPAEEIDDKIPEDMQAMIVVKISQDDKVGIINLWQPTFNDAYEIQKYFKSNIEPLELEL